MKPAIWLDGSLCDADSARVSVFDHGLTVGDGVFETVKATEGRPFALTRHLRRRGRAPRRARQAAPRQRAREGGGERAVWGDPPAG
ncbi:hypothetical protein ACFWMG_40105, partial [Streptomyces sp. NPDC127074]